MPITELQISPQVKAATNDLAHQIDLQLRINQQQLALDTSEKLISAGNSIVPPQPMSADVMRQSLILSLAPNYMKPNNSTSPDSMGGDAERDATYLIEAVTRVLAKV